jgi:alkylation response protein AidB-like acyl-CoA dehydrogenase
VDLSLSSDQEAILDAIGALARPFAAPPIGSHGFSLTSTELDKALAEGGFLDVALEPELGAVTAALVVERVAKLPYAVEAGGSALVRPVVDPELPRPICLVEAGELHRPIRFLAPGAVVVVVGAERVSSFTPAAEQVRAPEECLFAYPMALVESPAAQAQREHAVSPDLVRTRWRTALAAEAAGLLAAALETAVTYVSERKQFGRPIAAFQAVRHRLAEAEVKMTSLRWLALKAAATDDAGDAALAALYAQEAARAVAYDLHQFLGAMGMTLEHPLHLWTYRLKALIGELGGRGAQAAAAADAIWGGQRA